jgi:hypothetical protein
MSDLIYLYGGAQSSWHAPTSQLWEYSPPLSKIWKHDANAKITSDPKVEVLQHEATSVLPVSSECLMRPGYSNMEASNFTTLY